MKNPFNSHFYITEKGYDGIKNFKYKGGSISVFYAHIWSPLCNWIVENIVPSKLAPNLITFLASLQFILTHIAIMYYSPDFQSPIPNGLLIWTGFSILIYQILDNVDGKQARATGSSSPLGMLFDHGCDSVMTWVMALTVMNCIGIGQNAFSYFVMIVMSQISFFVAQWSQYHVGVFKLGEINAIDEGLVLVESIFFVTGILGQGIWSNELFGFKYNQIMLFSSLMMAVFQIIVFIHDTVSQKNELKIFSSLKCAFWLAIAYSLVYYFSPEEFIAKYGLYVTYSFGALFSKVTLQIQLAHLTHEKFNQFTFSFVFGTLFLIISFVICNYMGVENLHTYKYLLYIAIVFGILSEVHMAVCVSLHISEVLGIHVFQIGKRSFKPVQSKQQELCQKINDSNVSAQ